MVLVPSLEPLEGRVDFLTLVVADDARGRKDGTTRYGARTLIRVQVERENFVQSRLRREKKKSRDVRLLMLMLSKRKVDPKRLYPSKWSTLGWDGMRGGYGGK